MFLCMDNTVTTLLYYVPDDWGNTMETAMATQSDPDAEHMAEHSLSDPEHMVEHSLSDLDAEYMAEHTVAGNTTGETLDTGRRNNSYTLTFTVSFIWVSF